MNWEEWPNGSEEYVDDTEHSPNRKECPVCHTALRPMKTLYTSTPNSIIPERRIFYVTICPKCRTQYLREDNEEAVHFSPDAEAITELEERVRTLEETLSRLIAWIRTQQQQKQPKAIQAQPQEQKSNNDAEDFTRRYHHLL